MPKGTDVQRAEDFAEFSSNLNNRPCEKSAEKLAELAAMAR
jgi:hypothetical protein